MIGDWALKGVGLDVRGRLHLVRGLYGQSRGRAPRVNGMEDFALFAQPNRLRALEAAVRALPAQTDPRRTGRLLEIDMTPIGATQVHATPKPDAPRRAGACASSNSTPTTMRCWRPRRAIAASTSATSFRISARSSRSARCPITGSWWRA